MLESEGERRRFSDRKDERWLTYAEIGNILGVSAAAARMLAKRRGWPRRTPNAFGERARVLVPDDVAVHPRSASYAEHTAITISGDQVGANGHDQPHDQANVRVIEQAIAALQEQLAIANSRAERAEQRVDELRAELADAHRRFIEHLTERRPWWRRWFR